MFHKPITLQRWMSRWTSRGPGAAPSSLLTSRIEVCPPALWPSSLSWRGRFERWATRHGWVRDSDRPVNRLAAARQEFLRHLTDLPGDNAEALCDRVRRVRSLRELWHLRLPLYSVVALELSQTEAEARLAELNHHFPVRSTRTTPGATALAPRG